MRVSPADRARAPSEGFLSVPLRFPFPPFFFFPEVDGLNGNMNLREPEVAVLGNTLEGADTTTVAIIEQFQY